MPYHRENLKQKLIDQAYKAIKKDGIETISLRQLAKKAKVSQTAPYRHFQSKDHLLIEVCLQALSNLRDQINAIDSKNPRTKAINGAMAFIDFGLKNEKIYDLILSTISGESTKDPLRIALFESADYTFNNLRDRITAVKKRIIHKHNLMELKFTHLLLVCFKCLELLIKLIFLAVERVRKLFKLQNYWIKT